MKFWVAITDGDWFQYLRKRQPEEVNFWQPSAAPLPNFLQAGVPFLFKLKSPDNFIVGGGFFVRYSVLPSLVAWAAFGDKNGAADYPALRKRLSQWIGPVKGDPEIGCSILNAPFFWPRERWIPVPKTWKPNIQRGLTFDTETTEGMRLWNAVEAQLADAPLPVTSASHTARYGAEYLTRARLGQGAFRVLVTEAYGRRCAVTGERTLPVLEAAHIKPYAETGPHLVANGVLLRSDLHTLFDRGYMTVTDDLRIEVSKRIKEEYENGREYYQHRGKPLLILPGSREERPSSEFLRWHNEHVFLG